MARTKERGFTLLEILVVVVIIGVLAAILVPNFVGRGDQARVTATKTSMRNIANTLEIYRLDNFHYPSSEQGLQALIERPTGFPEPRGWGPEPYLKSLPLDPWGNEFTYQQEGTSFDLTSYGADGKEGGEGVAADILLSQM